MWNQSERGTIHNNDEDNIKQAFRLMGLEFRKNLEEGRAEVRSTVRYEPTLVVWTALDAPEIWESRRTVLYGIQRDIKSRFHFKPSLDKLREVIEEVAERNLVRAGEVEEDGNKT